jgi:hypothetical protein
MTVLDKETLPDFLDRFQSLNDAIIRLLEYHLPKTGGKRLTVTLSTQDSDGDGGWSNVRMTFDAVSELNLRDGNFALQVLSDGLSVAWIDNLLWCDFSPYAPEPASVDEYRRSNFSVAATTCTWQVEPYKEN